MERFMPEIVQLDSKIVYQNRWMLVREDKIQRSSGAEGIYGVVEKSDFALIIPVQKGQIYIVEQYRYPAGKRFWELPQGSLEKQEKFSMEEVAAIELREETGLVSKIMQYVGEQYVAYGYSTQKCHIFFATDLKQGPKNLEEEEDGLISKTITLADFEKMIADGTIQDAATINAYLLAKLKGFI
jgi:8-oxo-dGTP pyrophosphatase MutT (NUDIX family)